MVGAYTVTPALGENPVDSFCLGGKLNGCGAGHTDGLDAGIYLAAAQNGCGHAQIGQAALVQEPM